MFRQSLSYKSLVRFECPGRGSWKFGRNRLGELARHRFLVDGCSCQLSLFNSAVVVSFEITSLFSHSQATEAELERELQKRERELAAMTGQPTSPDGAGVFGTFEAFINSASGYGGVGHDNGSEFFDSDDGSSCGDSNDEAAPQATRTSCKIVLDPERFLQILSGQYGTGKVVGTSAIPADEGCQKPAGAAPPTQRVFRTERVESRASDTSDMMNSSGEDDEDDEPSVSDYMVICCGGSLPRNACGLTVVPAGSNGRTVAKHETCAVVCYGC
jgi:hypothetical protein